jgi:capsular exopolysaccharide synthesis family protein
MQLATLRQRFGPSHRQILSLEDDLASVQTLIDARVALAMGSSPAGVTGRSQAEELQLRRRQVMTRLEDNKTEARRIGKIQLDIDRYREEAARADEKFREADKRLESLMVQQRDGEQGRISIAERADTPLQPSTDRRIPLAAMGGLGGGGIGVGLVVLFGLLNPRYRYIGDIAGDQRNIRIMGAIPEIDSADPVARHLVATSVHQIRTAIDARLLGPADGGVVHVVTSATSGEGKSTLCLRLARSFAVSGKRTLVIDADLIGRRVSAKFELGSSAGFAEATMHGADPMASVHKTDEENLFVMPAGPHSEHMAERISVAAVAGMLDALRTRFGAVVIDTGPILGSIEAQAIVPACDEVVLVVSRGRGVRLVKLAIDQLHRLGAARVGIVFNRATFHDLERSTSMSVTSQRVSERDPDRSAYAVVESLDGATESDSLSPD